MGSTRTSNVSLRIFHGHALLIFPVSEGLRFVGSSPVVSGHDQQSFEIAHGPLQHETR